MGFYRNGFSANANIYGIKVREILSNISPKFCFSARNSCKIKMFFGSKFVVLVLGALVMTIAVEGKQSEVRT